ncbi:hypothetical protein FNV43_RR08325 [Rhamnella rubrinervis]|uniref:Uncharacterized protein n=1 Tax=Rhamnella rubrinervis TaxID=2594499 RepID=A0A8K0MN61_9ROSA|nr:hypothetical protein FNV43_RR08325 [Rhamnella rubrinervis]
MSWVSNRRDVAFKYTYAQWEPLTAKERLPFKIDGKKYPILRGSPNKKIGLTDVLMDTGRIKSFKLSDAILYSYGLDIRFVLFLSIFLGFQLWMFIAPELLLNKPSALCSPNLKYLINSIQDTYVNKVCVTHPELSDDIHFIYKDLTEKHRFSMSCFRLAVIQQEILSGLYDLSPLQIREIKMNDLAQFLLDTLPACPDLAIMNSLDREMVIAVMPDKEDVLVLMGLSVMLLRLSHGSLPKSGYRIENPLSSFYYSLQQMGKVDRLYKIDLMESLRYLPISLVLDKIKHFVGDGSVYKLISSFLSLPINDNDGKNRKEIITCGIPPVGEITRVLFNIVLMEIFDQEFTKGFPGVAFKRFVHEVYITTRGNDKVIFNEKVGYTLLKKLGLVGKIDSIGPGDDPLLCYYQNLIFLDNECNVRVCNPKEEEE